MNKKQLINKVAERSELTRSETESVINAFMEVVKEELLNGENVKLLGFGTFENKIRKERVYRNPKNNSKVTVPEHIQPSFKVSDNFKNFVNKYNK